MRYHLHVDVLIIGRFNIRNMRDIYERARISWQTTRLCVVYMYTCGTQLVCRAGDTPSLWPCDTWYRRRHRRLRIEPYMCVYALTEDCEGTDVFIQSISREIFINLNGTCFCVQNFHIYSFSLDVWYITRLKIWLHWCGAVMRKLLCIGLLLCTPQRRKLFHN